MNREFLENLGIEVASEGEEEILFKCPFHDDKNPSASYNITDRVYNCFVCGGGSLKTLAKFRGSSVGRPYAEAFVVIRHISDD